MRAGLRSSTRQGACREDQKTQRGRMQRESAAGMAGPIAAAFLAWVLAGCTPAKSDPTPPSAAVIVDVHAHAFGARHLPVAGFVSGYKGWPGWAGKLVARIINLLTWDQIDGRATAREVRDVDFDDTDMLQLLRRVRFDPKARADPFALAQARGMSVDDARMPRDPVRARFGIRIEDVPLESRALIEPQATADDEMLDAMLDGLISPAEAKAFVDRGKFAGYVKLAVTLVAPPGVIAQRLVDTYPAVDLFVPLMMDMEPWFPGFPRPDRPLKRQVADMQQVIREHPGRIHPFLPFDPVRQLETGGEALAVVRDNIGQGFLGVKVYPPMGFRAWDNAACVKDEGENHPLAAQLDAALAELYDLCVLEDVPIVAHCSPEGAQSGKDRGKRSNPVYWKSVLERKAWHCLRLDLGHMGGPDLDHDEGWSAAIGQLMTAHPNVYADLSYGDIHTSPEGLQAWERFLHRYPVAEQRLMFGSDWMLVLQESGGENYLARCLEFFSHLEPAHPGLTARVFGGNALDFLGLRAGGENRARLAAFYLETFPTGFRPAWW